MLCRRVPKEGHAWIAEEPFVYRQSVGNLVTETAEAPLSLSHIDITCIVWIGNFYKRKTGGIVYF